MCTNRPKKIDLTPQVKKGKKSIEKLRSKCFYIKILIPIKNQLLLQNTRNTFLKKATRKLRKKYLKFLAKPFISTIGKSVLLQ